MVDLVEAVQHGTVDVDDGDQGSVSAGSGTCNDGDDDLAPAVTVAGDMAREGVHVGDEPGLAGCGGGAAHAAPEGDGLAGYFSLEGAKDELGSWGGVVEGVKAWLFIPFLIL